MPRNMSFALTTEQIRNRSKTVTRRIGWWDLKPGDMINACVKCMGLKRFEKVEVICQIKIVAVRREELVWITQEECRKEGFPNWTPKNFVDFFMAQNKCSIGTVVNRIEFEYL